VIHCKMQQLPHRAAQGQEKFTYVTRPLYVCVQKLVQLASKPSCMLFSVCLALLMSHEALAWQSTVAFGAPARNHAATAAAAAATAAEMQTETLQTPSAAAADKYLLLCTGGLEHVAAELVRNFLGPSEISVEAMQRQVRFAVAFMCTQRHSSSLT
jgi:hypothetical protein